MTYTKREFEVDIETAMMVANHFMTDEKYYNQIISVVATMFGLQGKVPSYVFFKFMGLARKQIITKYPVFHFTKLEVHRDEVKEKLKEISYTIGDFVTLETQLEGEYINTSPEIDEFVFQSLYIPQKVMCN